MSLSAQGLGSFAGSLMLIWVSTAGKLNSATGELMFGACERIAHDWGRGVFKMAAWITHSWLMIMVYRHGNVASPQPLPAAPSSFSAA
jgi:hypothetical protein